MTLQQYPIRRSILVIVATVICTTVVVRAGDIYIAQQWGEGKDDCGDGAIALVIDGNSVCVDRFLASPAVTCPHQQPENMQQHRENLQDPKCAAVSASAMPLRFVALSEAERYCAHAGKRIPRAREWHLLAEQLSIQQDCHTTGTGPRIPNDGEAVLCESGDGVVDLVGNLWEWVDATVQAGTYQERTLPPSGYVTAVGRDGIAQRTSTSSDQFYDDSYAWTYSDTEVGGILRGGFYGSDADAGRYAQQLGVSLEMRTAGIGFRCIRDI